MCTLPLSIWIVASNPVNYQYIGLTDLHSGFGRVRQYPLEIWINMTFSVGPSSRSVFALNAWTFIFPALLFFALFGFAEEAKKHYRKAFLSVAKTLGVSSSFGISGTGFTYVHSLQATNIQHTTHHAFSYSQRKFVQSGFFRFRARHDPHIHTTSQSPACLLRLLHRPSLRRRLCHVRRREAGVLPHRVDRRIQHHARIPGRR